MTGTIHNAWVEAAAIAAVATPLYLIWLINFLRTGRSLPSESAGQPTATDSRSPLGVSRTPYRRGTAGCETAAACPVVAALSALGAELEQVQFQWRRGA